MAVQIEYKVNTEEIIKANEELQSLNETTDDNAKETSKLNASFGTLGDSLTALGNRFQIAGKGLGDLAGGAVKATGGVGGLTTGFRVLDKVLKASGIGLIVAAVVSLGVALTNTAKGGRILNQVLDIGTGIFKGFVRLITDFRGTLQRGLINTFQDSIDKQRELRRVQGELADATIAYTKDLALLTQAEELANQRADDATLSLEKQRQAAQRAFELAQERAQLTVDLTDKQVEAIERELDANVNLTDAKRRELQQQLADVIAANADANTELERLSKENATRLRQIDQDQFEQRLDFLIDFTDNQKAINERIIADTTRPLEERQRLLNETIAFTDQAFEKAFKSFEEQAGQQLDINMLLQESDADVVSNYLRGTELSEIETTRLLEFLRERRTFTQDLAETQKDLDDEQAERNKANAEEEERLSEERKAREKEAADFIRQLDQEVADSRVATAMMAGDAVLGIINQVAEGNRVAAFAALAIEKGLAVADVIITLQRELAAIAANAAANPANAVTGGAAGVAQFATLSTLAKTRAGIGIATIVGSAIADVQAFKDGVIDLQGAGTSTSDSIPARLSRGESVMTALETTMFKPTLKAIRDGEIDPQLLNSFVTNGGSQALQNNPTVIPVETQNFTLDNHGFTSYVNKRNFKRTMRANKYKTL